MNKIDKSIQKSTKSKSKRYSQFFWLTFLVVSLSYAWYSFYVPPNDVVWADNMVEAQELAKDSDKNLMLFFTGAWCVPCRVMKREIFADSDVAKSINATIVPVIIDVDSPDAKEIVERYQAGVTPLVIFTDYEGEVLDYAVGKIGKTKFLEMLNNIEQQ